MICARGARVAALALFVASIPAAHAIAEPVDGPPAPDLDPAAPEAWPRQIAAWDDMHAVSAGDRWRSVMAWRDPLHTPLTWTATADELSPQRYPHPEGRDDPAADLVASIVAAQTHPRAFGCRFPLRAAALADLGVLPHPTPLVAGDCPAFERWARLETVEGVEIVFATPSFAEAATTAGHILFRVRSRPQADMAPVAEAVWSYGVDLSRPSARTGRLFKGLVGALRGEVLSETARDLDHRYGVVDRRDLWVYDLRLDRRELRLLLARLWVQTRDEGHGGYSFFSVNCARLTHDTLRAVLPDLRQRAGWFMHPHEVLGELWRAGRLAPRGIVYSRRSRARRAERRREALAEALAGVPGFTAAHRAAEANATDRAIRYAAIGAPAHAPLQAKLTDWADATLDVELYLADTAAEAEGDAAAAVDHPALDAALDLRAGLPPGSSRRLDPFPDFTIGPSGSRRVALGLAFDGARPITRLRVGMIDEQPGEARAVALRRSSRFEFLVSETTIGWPLEVDWPTIRETRLTLLATTDMGTHVDAVDGPVAARLDLLADFGLHSAPAHGTQVGGWLRIGEGLTVLAADDHTGFWVVGVDGQVLGGLLDDAATAGDAVRGELGLWTEVIAPLGRHHLRLDARLAPGWALDGYALNGALDGRLDLLLDPRRPLFVSPYGRWQRGGIAPGWEVGLALSL